MGSQAMTVIVIIMGIKSLLYVRKMESFVKRKFWQIYLRAVQ